MKHASKKLTNLREKRLLAGMSLSQLSRESGVSLDTISKAENGGLIMDWAAARIANALNLSVEQLEGSDE